MLGRFGFHLTFHFAVCSFFFVDSHVFTFSSLPSGTGLQCSSYTVPTNRQIQIQEGDIYSVFLSTDSEENTLPFPLIANSPGGRLYLDGRDNFVDILRRNDLDRVTGIGIHLSADISKCKLDPITRRMFSVETASGAQFYQNVKGQKS